MTLDEAISIVLDVHTRKAPKDSGVDFAIAVVPYEEDGVAVMANVTRALIFGEYLVAMQTLWEHREAQRKNAEHLAKTGRSML
jgi:hypothetical protein